MTETTADTPEPAGRWPLQVRGMDIKPLRNRVRVLMEVIDDPDEIALVSAAFRSQDWIIRPSTGGEVRGYTAKGRAWLMAEVRFAGYSRSAPKVAVRRIDQLAKKFHLGVWVRHAEVIDFPRGPEKTYYLDEIPPQQLVGGRLLPRALRSVVRRRTTGLVRLSAAIQETEVRAVLARLDLGEPFDPTRNSIRPAHAVSPAPPGQQRLGISGLLLAVLSGVATIWVPGDWKAISLLVGFAMVALICPALPANQSSPRRIYRAIASAVVCTLTGVIIEGAIPNRKPLIFVGLLAVIAAIIFTWRGVTLALRDSNISRHVSWAIPLAVTALAPLALALGGTFDAEYLTYHFGIPSNAVSVPAFLRLAIASKSILIGLAVVLFFVAVIGWVRYFYGFDETRELTLLLIVTMSLFYLIASVGVSLSLVDGAANDAAMKARAGLQPNGYFGLQGTLECVQPIGPSIPVYNSPLPIQRPVLSFGASGSQLWMWDPESGRAISVPLQDIIATPATGRPVHC